GDAGARGTGRAEGGGSPGYGFPVFVAGKVRVDAGQRRGHHRRGAMDLYVIMRRSGWQSPAELQEAAERSTQVGNDEMPDEVRWIRSYVLNEDEGSVGTVCIYEAVSADALRRHASLGDLPADEIIPVADTVIVRDDP